jgi:Fe-S cluster assembly ATP-binding protein
MSLHIVNLHARVSGGQEILHGLNLEIEKGRVHAVMGPNGSGKSTLSKLIAGHPDYEVTDGDILLEGRSILGMSPDERARAGLFLAFQYPVEIPGVSNANFIRAALQARLSEGEELEATTYYAALYQKMDSLQIPRAFTARSVNEGFSGGEKKRNEVLQMAMLKPAYAILDETDSGLDIDALKIVADGVNSQRGPELGMLVITHYQRLLDYIRPDVVHVLLGGRIVRTAGPELALELEARGYDWIREELEHPALA